MLWLVDDPSDSVMPAMFNPIEIARYAFHGGTALSTFGGIEGVAWVKTKYADPEDDWPDVELHLVSSSDVSELGFFVRKNHGVSQAVWDEYFKPINGRPSFSIMPLGLRPKSRGWIRLRSANPYDPPVINPNYFDHPEDVQVAVEGVKIAWDVGYTKALRKFGAKFYDKPFPGCEHHEFWSDEYLACWVKGYARTMVHDVGTCKMGPDSDPEAVVNPQLKVRGIKGLRVADNSIMPLIPSGNTNAIAVIILLIVIVNW